MAWDEGLEGKSYEIASCNERILRVVAGPGTGKTYSLKYRLARFLEEGVDPKGILLVTFTRIAAQDLADAINELEIEGVTNIVKGTLHSFCNSVLRDNYVDQLTNRVPRILLDFEKKFLLLDFSNKEFGDLKSRTEKLKAFEAAWARRQDEEPGWPNDPIEQQFSNALENWLVFHQAMLLGELVPRTLRFLRNNPHNEILHRFTHIFIDEYQDLNKAEQRLLDLLGRNSIITVIGDEDQSIYETLKYAHPEGISEFHLSHKETFDIPIEECRRCPPIVVNIANDFIRNNENRSNRELLPRVENPKGVVAIAQWETIEEEISGVVDYSTKRIRKNSILPGELLILAPRRQIGYLIRDGLRNNGIDAHSFFREPLLDLNPKDSNSCQPLEAYSLLLLLENDNDFVALRCWLGYGSNSLRAASYKRIVDYSLENSKSTFEIINLLIENQVSIPYTSKLVERSRLLKAKLNQLENLKGWDLIDGLFPEGNLWSKPFRELFEERLGDDKSISNIVNLIKEQATQPELPTKSDYVRIMSLQKSKGLSADNVIITNCVQGLIPTLKETEPYRLQRELEEQRRLFYVAITRTRKSLLITNSATFPYDLAKKMGAKIGKSVGSNLIMSIASDFINDLGQNAPMVINGENLQ
jgi:DNA helicase II / ATP-dependent DNA helicase PcrA